MEDNNNDWKALKVIVGVLLLTLTAFSMLASIIFTDFWRLIGGFPLPPIGGGIVAIVMMRIGLYLIKDL